MAKTDATRSRTRRSKVVTSEVVEEQDNVSTEGQTETVSSGEQIVRTEEEMKQDQDEQDSQKDTVIEVKGSTSTVTVSWDKKNDEGKIDDMEKRTNASDQMMDSEKQITFSADAVGSSEDAPAESTETKQEIQQSGDKQESDTVAEENESTPTVTVTWEKKNEEGERDDIKKDTSGGEQMIVKETAVNGKRKAQSTVETSPSKKTKLINDGFCLFVGNLNNSKTFEEVKDSLANYFMTQSLLVQDIRLDQSKKHAYVDLASEMDLTKALTLNGEMVLDKPMKIAKAKIKSEDKGKVKSPAEDKKAKDGRCLFLKNVPYNATKKDILKIFRKAVAVRFPGGTEGPNKGIAFVEFKNKTIAKKIRQKKRVAKIQGRVLIVDRVGETNVPKVTKANDSNTTKAAAPPNNTLFVSNLSYNVKEKNLKKVFQKAVSINIPQRNGKPRPRGFAFVEFATVADAEKALQSSQNIKICKREVRVQFCEMQAKSEKAKVLSKTLIVMGLADKTTAETLKSAFEGALSARVTVDKKTGVSKRFGFVEFEREENCKAVKEAMEDCEIDGSKVTVAYAKPKGEKGPPGARGGLAGRPGGQPAGQAAGRGGRGSRGGRGRGAGTPQDAVKEVENKG
ncbi:nucleolin-like isoform X2 [Siniperca chuatsi]|uniref:nucleolin-like isoform X2 n=1 Tax=Siniperca chuatsi TaxID=119488 RepID=UPI001CE07E6E|nr:nucleolin-like isoform X2 [Siniperca chuatsi]